VIPGGGVDGAEHGAEAASREIFEEAGINIPAHTLHHHGEFTGAHTIHPCTVNVYAVHLDHQCMPQPKWYSIEIAAARFVPVAQLASLDDRVEPGCLRRIHEVVDQQPAASIW
jgi:8-oxo-dGTP pyrophosphatase MutT (NUDIX family)